MGAKMLTKFLLQKKTMRFFLYFSVSLVFFSGGTLLYFKHHILQIEKEYIFFSKCYNEKEEQLALLKTEWAYLTHPKRVAELAHKYYPDMLLLKKEQILENFFVHHDVEKKETEK